MKQNWFKTALLIVIVLSALYYFYLETKKHNLDVVNSVRLCAALSGDAVKDCAAAVKRQRIP
jgi:hypothetical protein